MKIIFLLAQKIRHYLKPIAVFDSEEKAKAWIENNVSSRERYDFVLRPMYLNPSNRGFVETITMEQMKEAEHYLANKHKLEL